MATKLVELNRRTGGAPPANWRACHLFYHSGRHFMVRHLIRPFVAAQLRAGAIDRFYFVRYGLGGPHIRLRWRVSDARHAESVDAALAEQATRFFLDKPSTKAVPEEDIRRTNLLLLRHDPANRADGNVVFEDNTYAWFPIVFEFERYGGHQRLGASLDLFHCSSAVVTQMLAERAQSDPGWVRPAFMKLTLHLAWGFAGDDEDFFLELVDYGARFMGESFAPFAALGEEVFALRSAQLVETVRREIDRLPASGGSPRENFLAAAASQLSTRLDGLSESARWYLAASHIHMTANRLGLTNPEEVYLSRMLFRTVETLRKTNAGEWRRFRNARAGYAQRSNRDSIAETAMRASVLLA